MCREGGVSALWEARNLSVLTVAHSTMMSLFSDSDRVEGDVMKIVFVVFLGVAAVVAGSVSEPAQASSCERNPGACK